MPFTPMLLETASGRRIALPPSTPMRRTIAPVRSILRFHRDSAHVEESALVRTNGFEQLAADSTIDRSAAPSGPCAVTGKPNRRTQRAQRHLQAKLVRINPPEAPRDRRALPCHKKLRTAQCGTREAPQPRTPCASSNSNKLSPSTRSISPDGMMSAACVRITSNACRYVIAHRTTG